MRFPEFSGEWEMKSFGEITEKIGDGLHGTPIYVENSDFYFINGNNLVNGKIELNNNTKKVNLTTFSKNDKGLNKNTLLISINGTIGNIAKYNEEKVMLGKSIGYFNFKTNSDYFYYVLQTNLIQDYFISELTGSTIKNLSLKTLRETTVSYPLISEQQKIATFLSLIDERIQTQNKIIEGLKSQIQGFREHLFSQKIRFKDINGNEFLDWENKSLGEICEKKSSNISANKIEDNFGEYLIYGASGVLKKIDFYEEKNDYISIVKDGAGVGRLFYCKGKSSVLGTMDIIKPKNTNSHFLFYLLSNIDFTKYVTGSTIPHIYFKDYKNENFGIPCFEEQTKIANFLSSIDSKIDTEKQILQKLEEQKKYLLQNLFV